MACFLRSQLYLAPVLLLFYQQNGLTIADFVLFQGIFQLTGILFEIPCGYIADVIPKKGSRPRFRLFLSPRRPVA